MPEEYEEQDELPEIDDEDDEDLDETTDMDYTEDNEMEIISVFREEDNVYYLFKDGSWKSLPIKDFKEISEKIYEE